jgi:transcriptional regulator with XRE-family HTH domain
MRANFVDPTLLGERLAAVRRAYGESIDLANLGRSAFAALLGVSVTTYASYESGESEPTIDFLLGLRTKTGISLDWFLEPADQRGPGRFNEADGPRSNPVQAIRAGQPVVCL